MPFFFCISLHPSHFFSLYLSANFLLRKMRVSRSQRSSLVIVGILLTSILIPIRSGEEHNGELELEEELEAESSKPIRLRAKRGSQEPRKSQVAIGYPRLINPPPSGAPILNQIPNDTSITSTWHPQLQNPLYPLGESSLSAYGVLLLSLVVFAVGIIGNLSVMCIVWHSLYLKSAWDSILAGLALWDFMLLFFCLPVVVFHEITRRRLLGVVSCRVVPYMEVSSLGVSTFSLCALGIDRFQSITSPQMAPRPVEGCQSILGKLAVIWLGSLILALPEILLWQFIQEQSPGSSMIVDTCIMLPAPNLPPVLHSLVLTYQHARMWWFLGCYFCLPLLFTVTSLLVTLRIVGTTKDIKYGQCQRQLSWIVASLATVYGVCTLPENVTNVIITYTSLDVPRDLLSLITQFFLFLKCAVTPVLLLCLSKQLGQAFLDCCCCCCEEAVRPDSKQHTISERKEPAEEPLTLPYNTRESELHLGTPC